jgi:hypothetical protein
MIKYALCILLVCNQYAAFAQSLKLREGLIQYGVQTEAGKDPNISMLNGSTLSVYLKEDNLKVSGLFLIGLLGTELIAQPTQKQGLLLLDGFGKKRAVKVSEADLDDAIELPAAVKQSKETKQIAGYKCFKSSFKNPKGGRTTFYLTEQIDAKKNPLLADIIHTLKGFPLEIEFELPDKGGTVRLTAKSVEKKSLDNSLFSLDIPKGFELTTIEELQKSAPRPK